MLHQNISYQGLDANKRLQYIPTTLLFYFSPLHFIFFFSHLSAVESVWHTRPFLSVRPDQMPRTRWSCLISAPQRGGKVVKQTLRLGMLPQISSAERTQACKLERKSPQVQFFFSFFLFCAARAGQTCMQMTAVVRIRLRDSGCSFSTSHCKQRREHAAMNNASSRNSKVSDAAEPNVNYFRRWLTDDNDTCFFCVCWLFDVTPVFDVQMKKEKKIQNQM